MIAIAYCFLSLSDFQLMEMDSTSAYLTRIQHLAEQHSSTRFWLHDNSADQLLDEISYLLGLLPAGCGEGVLDEVIQYSNPYDYSLLKLVLNKQCNGQEDDKVYWSL